MISSFHDAFVRESFFQSADFNFNFRSIDLLRRFITDWSPEYSINLHSMGILNRWIPTDFNLMRIQTNYSNVLRRSRQFIFAFVEARYDLFRMRQYAKTRSQYWFTTTPIQATSRNSPCDTTAAMIY
jgi:hypothetical protein